MGFREFMNKENMALDSKPAGNKEDEEKIIKYTIVLMVIIFIMRCVD